MEGLASLAMTSRTFYVYPVFFLLPGSASMSSMAGGCGMEARVERDLEDATWEDLQM